MIKEVFKTVNYSVMQLPSSSRIKMVMLECADSICYNNID